VWARLTYRFRLGSNFVGAINWPKLGLVSNPLKGWSVHIVRELRYPSWCDPLTGGCQAADEQSHLLDCLLQVGSLVLASSMTCYRQSGSPINWPGEMRI
jgi:hypothetical protein